MNNTYFISQGDFLESGGQPTFRTFIFALTQWLKEKVNWKIYFFTWFIMIFTSITRITLASQNVNEIDNYIVTVPKNPQDYALLYKSIKSIDVVDEGDNNIAFIIKEMRATAAHYNYQCLAAIHIGYPLRIAFIINDEDGETILINPRIVAGEGGERISRAREISAFGGPAIVKSRQMPVTIRDQEGYHMFATRESVHCVLHVIDQFDNLL